MARAPHSAPPGPAFTGARRLGQSEEREVGQKSGDRRAGPEIKEPCQRLQEGEGNNRDEARIQQDGPLKAP